MKGTVIKRGKKWSVVIDLGEQACQVCSGCTIGRGGKPVDRIFWVSDSRRQTCLECGRPLSDSKRRRRKWHAGYATKREAEAARIEILSKVAQGIYVAPTNQTVGEWLRIWLEGRQSIADTTRDGYGMEVQRIRRTFGSCKLKDLSPGLISSFYSDLTAQGLAPKTVKNCHGVFHKALEDAVRQEVLSRNPASHVELPRAEQTEMEVWTADELRQFLAHTKSHRLHAAWRLLCSTGLRRSELLGVRWPNLDLNTGRMAVVDTVVPVNNKPVLRLGETKSRRSRRVINLDADTINVLRAHQIGQSEEKEAAGTSWAELGLVFTDALGGIVSPDWFTRTTKRLATEAGVPPLTPHSAGRHSWASLALAAGEHPKVVQERLGHSSIAITMDRYSHLIEGMDREAAERVAALIR